MSALLACSVKTVSEVSKQIHTEGREKILFTKPSFVFTSVKRAWPLLKLSKINKFLNLLQIRKF